MRQVVFAGIWKIRIFQWQATLLAFQPDQSADTLQTTYVPMAQNSAQDFRLGLALLWLHVTANALGELILVSPFSLNPHLS